MNIFLTILSVWVFIKTISYSVFEIKTENNKIGGITCVAFAFIALILPIYVIWFK